MEERRIISNGHTRPLHYWHDLPTKEREYFDYGGAIEGDYVKYLGAWYNLGDFERITPQQPNLYAAGWQGFFTETAFSAVVVKVADDGVILGYVLA